MGMIGRDSNGVEYDVVPLDSGDGDEAILGLISVAVCLSVGWMVAYWLLGEFDSPLERIAVTIGAICCVLVGIICRSLICFITFLLIGIAVLGAAGIALFSWIFQ